ncbi:MAG: metal-dependent transcriptional regulator [Candidatus Krumholzibacteriota bacterium]|nr:metal-dependent transcriptional regulator [Candidatus Krumholzibacteriota bacterium]
MDKKICFHDPEDEVLEAVWVIMERGKPVDDEGIINRDHRGIITAEMIRSLVGSGLLKKKGEGYDFTVEGRARGEKIIRRHRLAERLLADVLNVRNNEYIETNACRFEHFLSPEVTDHICVLLGHPKLCPHGNPIPPGECCERAQRQVESAVIPLSRLRSGEKGRVLYMTMKDHDRLDRLTSLGLFPGRQIKVHQREPSFVVFLDETQLALDKKIVEDIYIIRS